MGIFREGIFWVGIFRGGTHQGGFDAWEFSGWEFSWYRLDRIYLFFRNMFIKCFYTNSWKCIYPFFIWNFPWLLTSWLNKSKKVSLWMKVLNLWFYFKKMYFLHSYYHFVKDSTVCITYVFLKLSGLILNIK